jgi:hypothetical protein
MNTDWTTSHPDNRTQQPKATTVKTSIERILTTHVGSMPRPQYVVDQLFAQDRGENDDPRRPRSRVEADGGGCGHHLRWRDEQDQLRNLYPPPTDWLRNRGCATCDTERPG